MGVRREGQIDINYLLALAFESSAGDSTESKAGKPG